MNHSTSKRTAKAMAQVESTVYISGITKQIVKCSANKDFTVGNSSIKTGETFFLVASARRENRYYVVHFSEARSTYQCSCGANCFEHAHLKVVREHVMSTVVAKSESSEVPAMTVPATVAQVKAARKAKVEQTSEQFDGSRPLTKEEWKKIAKADKARQQAWQDEYRQRAKEVSIA